MSWLDRWVFVPYFVLHIIVSLTADIQGVLPNWFLDEHFPTFLRQAVLEYTAASQDTTLTAPEPWMHSLLLTEAIVQLPFFFIAVYALLARKNWIRMPAIIYSAHVMTTVIPCVAHIVASDMSIENKMRVAPLYLIFFFVPLLLLVRMASVDVPFPARQKSKSA